MENVTIKGGWHELPGLREERDRALSGAEGVAGWRRGPLGGREGEGTTRSKVTNGAAKSAIEDAGFDADRLAVRGFPFTSSHIIAGCSFTYQGR